MNYDAFAGHTTNITTRAERQARAVAYHEGQVQTPPCPFGPGTQRDSWFRGLYDGFVRQERSAAGGCLASYDLGFAAGREVAS
jgi:hypothetical protein